MQDSDKGTNKAKYDDDGDEQKEYFFTDKPTTLRLYTRERHGKPNDDHTKFHSIQQTYTKVSQCGEMGTRDQAASSDKVEERRE